MRKLLAVTLTAGLLLSSVAWAGNTRAGKNVMSPEELFPLISELGNL